MSDVVLIVDDDHAHRAMLRGVLSTAGYDTEEAASGEAAVERMSAGGIDAILLDLKMPGIDGLETLRRIHALDAARPVVMMTAYASVDTAVEAMRVGAYDYLSKPLDADEVIDVVGRTLARFRRGGGGEPTAGPGHVAFGQIVGQSAPMRDLFAVLELAAPSDATVLITGESGTGKELVARALHDNSGRSQGPFVAVNSVAIPRDLIETELFGHERGAFTGATQRRRGRFEQAHGGTLFLDEIGEMPGDLQARLLRVLQERQIERVGGEGLIPVDVRVIAATNRDLEAAVATGDFREDLFFRLSVVPVHLPPLRERRDDIPLLAEHLLTRLAGDRQPPLRGFTPAAMDLLRSYTWPGNVRELENAVQRASVLCRSESVDVEHLPTAVRSYRAALQPRLGRTFAGTSLKEVERELILSTLEEAGGNRSEAARILGISRQTLHTRLREYGIG